MLAKFSFEAGSAGAWRGLPLGLIPAKGTTKFPAAPALGGLLAACGGQGRKRSLHDEIDGTELLHTPFHGIGNALVLRAG